MSDRYRLEGHVPVPEPDLIKWAKGLESERRVAEDTVGEKWISTVFLGLDHQFGDGPPLVFETMVFPSKEDFSELYCDRYPTWDEAVAGHAKTVAWVKAGCPEQE